jgi:2-(1,2-epoxy-1,2-dihydrophenyl)acetyl-CoA isomerase
MTASVLLDIQGAVATLTLNRPDALNALDRDMTAALVAHTARLQHDPAIRCVLIRGAGANFMAGGDVKWFHSTLDQDPTERRALFELLVGDVNKVITAIRSMPKPVVAVVQGAAAGFGFSLMAACDLAIAADDSYLVLAYSQLGISPDGGATWSLPRLIGTRRAMELALLGDKVSAERALAFGLVNRLVPAGELDAAAAEMGARLAAGATAAFGRTKHLLNASLDNPLAAQLLAEQHSFGESSGTADFEEGLRAFVGKRKPVFTGR